MRTAIAAIALVVSVLAARADTVPYSHSFQFDGTCTGGDMWDQWTIYGSPPMPDYFVRPWHDKPITVIGYELVKRSHVRPKPKLSWWQWLTGWGDTRPLDHNWFMIGSTIQADAMLWMGAGETRSQVMWPAGLGQPFPSRNSAKPIRKVSDAPPRYEGDLLDIHGECPKGDVVALLMTVYFTIDASAATARAD
jgi:hypothetical protein